MLDQHQHNPIKIRKEWLIVVLALCISLAMAIPTPALCETTTDYGAFSVTTTTGVAPTYSNNVLTLGSGTYIVTMTTAGTTTTTDRIVVSNGSSADVTLNGVSIDVSKTYRACALELENAGACTITLAQGSTNVLKSGDDCPGIRVPNGYKLTINGEGSLEAYGGVYWPGIGRNGNADIEIQSGIIKAVGGQYASDIGGSSGFGAKQITISGGMVMAINGGIGSGASENEAPFSTGSGGSAVIITNSITDQTGKSSWSGLILEDGSGQIYGDAGFTLSQNLEMTAGKTLTIAKDQTLTIAAGTTLTNNGTIINNGTITNDGAVKQWYTDNRVGKHILDGRTRYLFRQWHVYKQWRYSAIRGVRRL